MKIIGLILVGIGGAIIASYFVPLGVSIGCLLISFGVVLLFNENYA